MGKIMRTPPADISIGDYLDQEEIEEVFDTGFGYRISGINPRRDSNDNRYVLLFANEDGPYDDSVTQGRFEYIGEGLEGDQSESSPGNSALIDAVSSDIPVYFFYQQAGDGEWEYQGHVDVLDYEVREKGGRDVLVYTIEHQEQSEQGLRDSENESVGEEDANETGLYLIPVSDYWRDKFSDSVESPIDLTQYDALPSQLSGESELRVWATTETDAANKQAAIDEMEAGDCILFYYEGEFFAGGIVERVFESPEVGDLIWNQPESRHIYTVERFTTDVPSIDKIWDWLGYEGRQVVRGFSRVDDDRLSAVMEQFGSVESAVLEYQAQEPTDSEIEKQKTKLDEFGDSDPQLTEEEAEFTETTRRARDAAFTQAVREAYNRKCAICGSERETPGGNPEVEAAHIYPKHEGGSDDVRNGIALCKLHHWAFDSGWLSLTDSCEVIVKDAPDRTGYHEFKRLEGESIHLPDEDTEHPHPKFIQEHRELHGFTDD
jgi:putative restriction endonuclease